MTDQSRPATGYPVQPQNVYPTQESNNYYYPNHNPYNYNAPPVYHQSPPQATFRRRFFAGFISVFIIFGVILLIVWLVYRPRSPTFTVDSLTVNSFNASNSPSQISGTWSLNFSVANPNSKLHVYYNDIVVRLFYRNSFLSLNQLPPFDQGTRSGTTMDATVSASGVYVDHDLVNRIKNDQSKGNVEFEVQVVAVASFRAGGWRARRRLLRVFCGDLNVGLSSSNGTLSSGPKRCVVVI